ncbi:flagellar biosynthetic protein FliO [Niveibacterium sp.]|uniref:flagellar biosynthetic protein FliO n=1 Tax=Niveibacterium sp. TaxID=2017444 RepID=UPI0035B41DB1
MPRPSTRSIHLTLAALLTPASASASVADAGGSLLSMLFGLAVVLASLYGLLHVIKRLQARGGNGQAALRIIGGTAVGPRERVVLVELGEKVLVLGVAPGRVTALQTLDANEVPRMTAPPPIEGDFQRTLAALLKGGRHEG